MADVRSLLRQQRTARRVQHPYAAYTDGGKLLCTLCRLQVKAESLWEKHLLSQGHRESLPRREDDSTTTTTTTTTMATTTLAQKRPLDEADDGDQGQESRVDEDTLRRKRSRLEAASPVESSVKNGGGSSEHVSLASPSLIRRTSTTPSQGVELQIPSRPATPSHRDTPSSSASGIAPPPPSRRRAGSNLTPTTTTTAQKVDEAEWAAFEADIAVAAAAPYDYEDAVISAPAMTAEESAAAKALDKQTDKLKVDIDLEEEREEAARAMEDEFQDMQELEERVKQLKDRREALRKRSDSHSQDHPAPEKMPSGPGRGKEMNHDTGAVNGTEEEKEEEEEEEDDDDDDDDWDGFRFRNS
ncbi:hypothetical protein L249_3054 [Ophiocordyceps polyrhachis-furcata BCC 54312]|uniref:Coiled-coil domain-containing protein 16 n=1 Tax=Ophiocordyceps polyrhachis-furcata BCC 54312 TaxID=1330021 RepID=A0A367LRE2_9HYPO|nr:hypothetical protein L249_3054 [Ophiocordyceps polyrhachis-furcata BCC 54312]